MNPNPRPANGNEGVKMGAEEQTVDLGRDADLDNETKPETQVPPRKRPRDTSSTNQAASSSQAPARKKQVRGKQGRLAGLMNMPIDIFTEIASHLLPADIITLARSNKFFRNMLMHRSSIHIWHGSMKNVPDLPPCPPDMSEPHYLSLVFSKTCSKCGKSARGKPDGILRVRLCGPCRDEFLMPFGEVPFAIWDFVYCSSNTVASGQKRRRYNLHVLSEDVIGLLAEYEDKKQLNDKSTLDAWTEAKIAQVGQRREESKALTQFLDGLDGDREKVLDNLKEARRSEIERRVKELGWADEDIPIYWGSEHHRAWNALVNQPKSLTGRVWANLQPKLIPLLEARRVERLEEECEMRKWYRQNRLVKLFQGIKEKVCFPLTFTVRESGLLPDSKRTFTGIDRNDVFPNLGYALAWPLVKNLYETDSTPEEMEAKFETHREETEALVNEWRTSVQTHFIEQAEAQGAVLRPVLTSFDGDSSPYTHLSDDLKRLQRADSIFYMMSGNEKVPWMYRQIVSAEGLTWSSPTTPHDPSPKSLDLDHIFWYPDGHEVARALLVNMGKPDIPYVEVKGHPSSHIYICGRCHDADRKTWMGMIQHYVEQEQMYSKIQKNLEGLVNQGIIYLNIHDPALNPDLPMIKRYEPQPGIRATKVRDEGLGPLQVCKVCEKIPNASEVVASPSSILRHLLDVHGIAEPNFDKHYAPKRLPGTDL